MNLWQVSNSQLVREHGLCVEVGHLEGQAGLVAIRATYKIADFIVNADAIAPIYVVMVQQPPHARQQQMEEVDS